jgi:hypothetical protein
MNQPLSFFCASSLSAQTEELGVISCGRNFLCSNGSTVIRARSSVLMLGDGCNCFCNNLQSTVVASLLQTAAAMMVPNASLARFQVLTATNRGWPFSGMLRLVVWSGLPTFERCLLSPSSGLTGSKLLWNSETSVNIYQTTRRNIP